MHALCHRRREYVCDEKSNSVTMTKSSIHSGDRDATCSDVRGWGRLPWPARPPSELDQWLSQHLSAQYAQVLAAPLPAELTRLLARLARERSGR
jgi:hypothetical protein